MRTVVWGGTFKRAYKRTLRKHSEWVSAIDGTLAVLATDPFDPRLETHKLKPAPGHAVPDTIFASSLILSDRRDKRRKTSC